MKGERKMKYLKAALIGLLTSFGIYLLLAIFINLFSYNKTNVSDEVYTQILILILFGFISACTYLIINAVNDLKKQLNGKDDTEK